MYRHSSKIGQINMVVFVSFMEAHVYTHYCIISNSFKAALCIQNWKKCKENMLKFSRTRNKIQKIEVIHLLHIFIRGVDGGGAGGGGFSSPNFLGWKSHKNFL